MFKSKILMLTVFAASASLLMVSCGSTPAAEPAPVEETAEEKASHLYGSGMFIINPPWQLKEKLEECISFYSKVLAY